MPGVAYGGRPGSFPWASTTHLYGQAPWDTTSYPVAYRIPGGIDVAGAPAGTPDSEVPYSPATRFDTADGSYRLSINAASIPGDHEIRVRSCFGALDAPVCASASEPVPA